MQFFKFFLKKLTQVEDPSKYGVVLYEEDGKIKSFVEKPREFIGNRINAGLYIFNTKMIKRIPVTILSFYHF